MKRGEVWTIRGRGLASKPRPVVIVQSDCVKAITTTTVCLLTSKESHHQATRVKIEPDDRNGLHVESWVMVDKLYAAWPNELGERIGELSDEEMAQVSEHLKYVLSL